MWLVIFPEGTRYSIQKPEAIEKSQKFAADHGEFKHRPCIVPRTFVFMHRSQLKGQYAQERERERGTEGRREGERHTQRLYSSGVS